MQRSILFLTLLATAQTLPATEGSSPRDTTVFECLAAEKATEDLWNQANKLFNETFYQAWKHIPFHQLDDDIADDSSQAFEAFLQKRFEKCKAQALREPFHFVFAREQDHLIGYALFGPLASTSELLVTILAVDQKTQGKGIGKKLLDHVALYFPTATSIVLSCRIHNTKAIGFYTKMGFSELQEGHKGVSYNPQYSVILNKDLKTTKPANH